MTLPNGQYRMPIATGGTVPCTLAWAVSSGQIEGAVREWADGTREDMDTAATLGLEGEVRERMRLGRLVQGVEFIPFPWAQSEREQTGLVFGRWE